MFNWRLYRAAFVPFVFALAIAAFSLTARRVRSPRRWRPTRSTARAFANLNSLAAEFPERRPGSSGDEALAGRVSRLLKGLGGTAGGGFSVRTRRFDAQTIDGERSLTTVIAQRPGSTGATPIVILAHRDAAARGSQAELSGTAALLELARVFAARETRRTIVLVSTSGGSGGDAGAADFAAHAHGTVRRGDRAGRPRGRDERKPFVVPFSDGFGCAPDSCSARLPTRSPRRPAPTPGAPARSASSPTSRFPSPWASRVRSTPTGSPPCSSRSPANGDPRRGMP